VPYQDRFFNPEQWDNFKVKQGKKMPVKELPYLVDNNFVLTGANAMLRYVIEKSNRKEILGRNLLDSIKIDMFKSK
jgi:glutathione S-transferase